MGNTRPDIRKSIYGPMPKKMGNQEVIVSFKVADLYAKDFPGNDIVIPIDILKIKDRTNLSGEIMITMEKE